MKISMINVSGRLSSDGSRLISALLKRAGHSVSSIYLSRAEPLLFEHRELAQLDPLLAAADLVMVSVYSSYAIRAVQVTEFIHERWPGKRVIWGGPHCISVPEIGLRHADGICFSEGDEAVVDLVGRMERGEEWLSTPNFAFRSNGDTVKNPVLPPFKALDSLPYYDFELADQYMLDVQLTPVTMDVLKSRLASYPYRIPTFYYMTSRGCPHDCAYCNNCRYTAMWGSSSIRLYGVPRVIDELEFHLKNLGFIEFVGFGDDDFFVRPMAQIEEFCRLYAKRIGLPFGVAVSARTWRRDKAEMLRDTGMTMIQMGVQSGSQRVLDTVFNRRLSLTKVSKAVDEASALARGTPIRLHLDFIIDNPYETRDDVAATFRYMLSTDWSVKLSIFFLAYFPGTPLYERALADGFIRPYSQKAFRPYTRSRLRYQKNWETFCVLLLRFLRLVVRRRRTALDLFLRACGSRAVRTAMSVLPGTFFAWLSGLLQATQTRLISRRVSVLR